MDLIERTNVPWVLHEQRGILNEWLDVLRQAPSADYGSIIGELESLEVRVGRAEDFNHITIIEVEMSEEEMSPESEVEDVKMSDEEMSPESEEEVDQLVSSPIAGPSALPNTAVASQDIGLNNPPVSSPRPFIHGLVAKQYPVPRLPCCAYTGTVRSS